MQSGMMMRLTCVAVGLASLALTLTPAWAQPEPSFRASCAELRAKLAPLDLSDGRLVTIEVEGALTLVQEGGALAYLGMCAPPDPQVLCIAYSAGERKAGDRAVLIGTLSPRGPDHVLLDPCLPAAP